MNLMNFLVVQLNNDDDDAGTEVKQTQYFCKDYDLQSPEF